MAKIRKTNKSEKSGGTSAYISPELKWDAIVLDKAVVINVIEGGHITLTTDDLVNLINELNNTHHSDKTRNLEKGVAVLGKDLGVEGVAALLF